MLWLRCMPLPLVFSDITHTQRCFVAPSPKLTTVAANYAVPDACPLQLDMSLDEIIKRDRAAKKEKIAELKAAKAVNPVSKSVGAGKANRAATLAKKRGLRDTGKATPMEVSEVSLCITTASISA